MSTALRACWHPVAYSADVAHAPLATTLLGPDRVPCDLAAELHLTFDAVAVAYRRAMRAHDFG